MRWTIVAFFCTALLCGGTASAHSVAVNLNAFLEGKQFVVLMGGSAGEPIDNAKLEFILFNQAGRAFRGVMPQAASGEYRAPAPQAPAGAYTLVLRDTTFPGEALEAKQEVRYPLVNPVQLLLPPSKAGAPTVPVLLILTLAPIALSLLVLGFILFARPKPRAVTHEEPKA
jgi:hypothetical protein